MKLIAYILSICFLTYARDYHHIDEVVLKYMKEGQVPGIALIVIKDGQLYLKKGYGYANLENQTQATLETLFEIGSTTKAFTGLGVIKLADEGKLDLQHPINLYLPWFKTYFENDQACIRVEDCLYHTSGIEFQTINLLPMDSNENALEKTIENINHSHLKNQPGLKFQYATINYDILGLLIQSIVKRPYHEFMKQEIFNPLQLSNPYLDREAAYADPHMATGYKIGFLEPRPYQAPTYKGNTPAGYLILNGEDVFQWLIHQINASEPLKKAILWSQKPNQKIEALPDGSFYAAGWFVFPSEKGKIYAHSGNNPNFSSYFAFSREAKAGVGVLANLNSNSTFAIGHTVMSYVLGQEPISSPPDMLQKVDTISVLILALASSAFAFLAFRFFFALKALYKGQRIWRSAFRLFSLPLTASCLYLLTGILIHLPSMIFWGIDWNAVKVWGPVSFPYSVYGLYAAALLCLLYLQFLYLFPKRIKNQ